MIVAEYFSRSFDAHVEHLSAVLREKLDTMVEAVEREFGTSVEMWRPEGGIFLWLKLPDHVDVTKLVKPAAEAGIAFNPGPEWVCDPSTARSSMRLCFALPSKQRDQGWCGSVGPGLLRADRHPGAQRQRGERAPVLARRRAEKRSAFRRRTVRAAVPLSDA